MSNASDALEGREDARIVVGAEALGDRVRLYVEDNGPGIPPELRKRIFDPFFTTKPVGKGTGIGLSISHGIVKGHNGEIRVEGNKAAGITFSVILPIHQPGRLRPADLDPGPAMDPGAVSGRRVG